MRYDSGRRADVNDPIRAMDVRDAARVAKLTGQLGYPVSEADLRDRLAIALAVPVDHCLLVAVDAQDMPIGWAHVERLRLLARSPAAQLAGLVVSEQHRSAGIGAALLERAEITARTWGCRSLLIRSNVVRERAHRFYERAGYRNIKTSYTFEKELVPGEAASGQVPGRGAIDGSLRDAWEAEADRWMAWARAPGHDSYWRFHRDRFLQLLPPPNGLTLDLGCGEGRFPRDLKARGYRVAGIDASRTMIEHARQADPDGEYTVADAADLPHADASVQLVTALLSLHDMDDMEGAVREVARVLMPGGHLCAAVVHPINSAGKFVSHTPDAPFVIRESYFEQRRYADPVERDGLHMTFTSRHRPLEAYFGAFEAAGLLIERVVEVPDATASPGDRWQRLPLFLHIRAVKP